MAELLTMPEVAAGLTEAVLAEWNVQVGEAFDAGATVMTVETDKALVDVEAPSEGALLHLLVTAGSTVPVGAPVAVQGAPGERVEDLAALLDSLGVPPDRTGTAAAAGAELASAPTHTTRSAETDPGPAAEAAAGLPAPSTSIEASISNDEVAGSRIFASPLARKMAVEAGLDLSAVTGTGPHGRIRKVDVLSAIATVAEEPQPTTAEPAAPPSRPQGVPSNQTISVAEQVAATFTDVSASRMRQAVARRLTESKQTIPHFYLRGTARVERLGALRAELNDGDVKISVNDLLVKAVAGAHTLVPDLNVHWLGDAVRRFNGVDVAIAVATDQGLVTPVVRRADLLTISELARVTRDLAARAHARKLQQNELEGGTVTVSNLGMYGTEEFAAIINPPQASILAVGATRRAPVIDGDTLTIGHVLSMTIAVDHRAVDGATAAQWLQALIELLEHPARLLR